MLQRDYLVNLISQFFKAIAKSLEKKEENDPWEAAESLENAISASTDIDGAVLLSLAPDSMASILQVSGTDPRVIGFIANSLKMESECLAEAGDDVLSDLRLAQATVLAEAYGIDLPETIQEFLDEVESQELFEEE